MRLPHSARGGRSALVAAALATCALHAPGVGAQTGPPTPPQPAVAAYRAPTIALAQPAGGGSVPQDRPVVVFRFAQGEPTDPLDARSFAVTVDGADRTALFQVTAAEAWGPLAPPPNHGAGTISPGAHDVTARICSVRGACGSVQATITVLAAPTAHADTAAAPAPSKGTRKTLLILLLLGALVEGARQVLAP